MTRFDKLFLGVAVERPPWIPATIEGIEHIGPEDTFDGDYGRLLEAAQNRGKGLASLSTPSWNQIMCGYEKWLNCGNLGWSLPRRDQ